MIGVKVVKDDMTELIEKDVRSQLDRVGVVSEEVDSTAEVKR